MRWSEADGGGRYVRVADGRVARLNATAAEVMDECADGTAADALARIAELHPARPRPGLERDVLDTVRGLRARGILAPAGPVSRPA